MRRKTQPARRGTVELELRTHELAPGGDAVGHVELGGERRAVFVRGACAGELVRVRVDASTRPARGTLLAVLERSPDRAEPPCAHVERCGACDWMHVAREAQREAHLAHVRAALPAEARDLAVAWHEAPRALRWRERARVHVTASQGRVAVGMHAPHTRTAVDVDTCIALEPALDGARAELRAALAGAHGIGEARLALGAPGAPRRAVVNLDWDGDLAADTFRRFERGVASGAWQGARILVRGATRPAVIGDPTPWTHGADGAPLVLAPGGFAQAHPEVNAALVRRVVELASAALPKEGGTVVELFAGAGNLTVALARLGAAVVAVEADEAACEAARANLRARGLDARVQSGDASQHPLRPAPHVLVLDPPRTGARAVAEALSKAPRGPRRVLYVSCDPRTLARDVARLTERAFVVSATEVFEMFPHTSHVETLCVLDRVERR
jgi:23S rRNA (uracil1939-C5)-methyltransferase